MISYINTRHHIVMYEIIAYSYDIIYPYMISFITNSRFRFEPWQRPEQCNIDLCKSLAICTNNKVILLCILC